MLIQNGLPRTTIALKKSTKARLDHSRAPGQCYDGFLIQLIELWEDTHNGYKKPTWKDSDFSSTPFSRISSG